MIKLLAQRLTDAGLKVTYASTKSQIIEVTGKGIVETYAIFRRLGIKNASLEDDTWTIFVE